MHIAQIAVQGGVAGIGVHTRLQRLARVFESAFGRVEHPQVVVRLHHFGIGLDQLAKALNGLVGLALLGLDHAFQKADLHIPGAVLFFLLHQFGCLLQLARLQGLSNGVCG